MNSRLLKSIFILKGFKVKEIAEKLGISVVTLHRKLENKNEFTRLEIKLLSEILKLTSDEIIEIFFSKQVTF